MSDGRARRYEDSIKFITRCWGGLEVTICLLILHTKPFQDHGLLKSFHVSKNIVMGNREAD